MKQGSRSKMTPGRLGLWVGGIAAVAIALGLVYESTPFPLDILIGIGVVYLLPVAVAVISYDRFRGWTFLTAPMILLVAFVGAVLGDYAAYRWGLWGLRYSDYGSDDMGGQTQLWLRLWFSLLTAVVFGIVVSLLAPVIQRRFRKAGQDPVSQQHANPN